MTTVAEALALAMGCHQTGDVRQAEQLYRQILDVDPQHAEALYLLGLLAFQGGRSDLAIEYLGAALRIQPHWAEGHYTLGEALRRQGRLKEAVTSYECSLRLQPDNAQAHNSLAIALAAQGKLETAEASLHQVLRLQPDNVDAYNNLGSIFLDQGKNDEAVASLQQALRLRPDFADALNNLGNAWEEKGRLDEAVACYRQALALQPHMPAGHNNLGGALQAQGQREEAEACLRQALRLQPDFPEAHSNLGRVLQSQGRLDEAMASYRQALALRPSYANAHNNLGLALREQGRLDEAVAHYRQALRLRPGFAVVHNNLGIALRDQGRLDEAVGCYHQALQLQPRLPDTYFNLGNALGDLGQLDEAAASYRRALDLRPDHPETYTNLGNVLEDLARLDEALACFDQALLLRPDYPEAHWNRALTWLLQGHLEKGWLEYEWRWRTKEVPPRGLSQPLWDGQPLGARTILLHAEQGLGDTLQFIRYAPLVKQRGGSVVVECQSLLEGLLARCPGIDHLVARGDPLPPFDVQAPLLSLPRILGTTLDDIPAPVSYLDADPDLMSRWRKDLGNGGFKVGIVWQGSLNQKRKDRRSAPLIEFAPLARVAGVRLYSLQKGPGAEQLAGAGLGVTDLGARLEDFVDTAAVLKNLDLVVTVDTAVAHLAGALGVPVWVTLSFVPAWRWLLDREDCPWYPSMRLFRQEQLGQWPEVFERVAGELRRRLAAGIGSARV